MISHLTTRVKELILMGVDHFPKNWMWHDSKICCEDKCDFECVDDYVLDIMAYMNLTHKVERARLINLCPVCKVVWDAAHEGINLKMYKGSV